MKPLFDILRRRLTGGVLTQNQVDGINIIAKRFTALNEKCGLDARHLGYILGTAYWETARTMQPIEEIGRGRSRVYGQRNAPVMAGSSRRVQNNHIYYGRGYVQLTWFNNYLKQSNKIGVDFVSNPALAMVPSHAADILVRGMLDGDFTGRKLTDYITSRKTDLANARRVVNGTDKAAEIARISGIFIEGLKAAGFK